jgi:hypothetical protein
MTYPTISLQNARIAVQAQLRGESIDLTELMPALDVNPEVEEVLQLLDVLLKDLDPSKAKFDSKARAIVHQTLRSLDVEILVNQDFWRYLSSIRYFEITKSRHPINSKSDNNEPAGGSVDKPSKNLENYGAFQAGVLESLFYRLFVGAELAFIKDSDDPYLLTRIHDVDLWQSHILRVLSGNNPTYVRALLTWFGNREAWYKAQKKNLSGQDKTKHLRDLVKRIRRHRSNVMHEFFSDAEFDVLINSEALESLKKFDI